MSLVSNAYFRVAMLALLVLAVGGCFYPSALRQQQEMVFKADAVYSPDGSKIAFISNADGDFDVYVMNANGTSLRKVTENEANDTNVEWAPNGSRLLFSSDRSGTWELYTMRTDGSDAKEIAIDLQGSGVTNGGRD